MAYKYYNYQFNTNRNPTSNYGISNYGNYGSGVSSYSGVSSSGYSPSVPLVYNTSNYLLFVNRPNGNFSNFSFGSPAIPVNNYVTSNTARKYNMPISPTYNSYTPNKYKTKCGLQTISENGISSPSSSKIYTPNIRPAILTYDTENIDLKTPRKYERKEGGLITRDNRTVVRIRTKNLKENPYAQRENKEKESSSSGTSSNNNSRENSEEKKKRESPYSPRSSDENQQEQKVKKSAGEKLKEKFWIQSIKKNRLSVKTKGQNNNKNCNLAGLLNFNFGTPVSQSYPNSGDNHDVYTTPPSSPTEEQLEEQINFAKNANATANKRHSIIEDISLVVENNEVFKEDEEEEEDEKNKDKDVKKKKEEEEKEKAQIEIENKKKTEIINKNDNFNLKNDGKAEKSPILNKNEPVPISKKIDIFNTNNNKKSLIFENDKKILSKALFPVNKIVNNVKVKKEIENKQKVETSPQNPLQQPLPPPPPVELPSGPENKKRLTVKDILKNLENSNKPSSPAIATGPKIEEIKPNVIIPLGPKSKEINEKSLIIEDKIPENKKSIQPLIQPRESQKENDSSSSPLSYTQKLANLNNKTPLIETEIPKLKPSNANIIEKKKNEEPLIINNNSNNNVKKKDEEVKPQPLPEEKQKLKNQLGLIVNKQEDPIKLLKDEGKTFPNNNKIKTSTPPPLPPSGIESKMKLFSSSSTEVLQAQAKKTEDAKDTANKKKLKKSNITIVEKLEKVPVLKIKEKQLAMPVKQKVVANANANNNEMLENNSKISLENVKSLETTQKIPLKEQVSIFENKLKSSQEQTSLKSNSDKFLQEQEKYKQKSDIKNSSQETPMDNYHQQQQQPPSPSPKSKLNFPVNTGNLIKTASNSSNSNSNNNALSNTNNVPRRMSRLQSIDEDSIQIQTQETQAPLARSNKANLENKEAERNSENCQKEMKEDDNLGNLNKSKIQRKPTIVRRSNKPKDEINNMNMNKNTSFLADDNNCKNNKIFEKLAIFANANKANVNAANNVVNLKDGKKMGKMSREPENEKLEKERENCNKQAKNNANSNTKKKEDSNTLKIDQAIRSINSGKIVKKKKGSSAKKDSAKNLICTSINSKCNRNSNRKSCRCSSNSSTNSKKMLVNGDLLSSTTNITTCNTITSPGLIKSPKSKKKKSTVNNFQIQEEEDSENSENCSISSSISIKNKKILETSQGPLIDLIKKGSKREKAETDSITNEEKENIGTEAEANLPSSVIEKPSDSEMTSALDSQLNEKDKHENFCPVKVRPKYRHYSIDDFQFLKLLGKGSFGRVLLAELKGSESYYAVKCLKKDVILEDEDVEGCIVEKKVLLMGSLHPFLCHLLCTFQSESHLFFVMEYLNGGDLMFHIQKSGKFEEERARFYGAEIVSGLKFLHKKSVIYRDLKLDNVLLDYEGHIRIADFGMCKLQIYLDKTADNFCGTPDYMAPEIIKGLRYNQSVDYWALGVLMYEMLTGQSPFSGCDEDELFWSICNESVFYPNYLSKESKRLLELLLEKDSSRRLGTATFRYKYIGDIVDQPFFAPINWEKLEARELEPPYKPNLKDALDVSYFDTAFTKLPARLSRIEKEVMNSMDQSEFYNFSYTNPHTTD